MKNADYKRGYDAGYKQALLDALSMQSPERRAAYPGKIGGPNAPYRKLAEGPLG